MHLNQLLRSLLYVPADSPRKIAKARTVSPDGFIFDLEDAVAPDHKAEARTLLLHELDSRPPTATPVCVRINGPGVGMLSEDLAVAVHPAVSAITLPKCENPQEIESIARAITSLESQKSITNGKIKLILILESPLGVFRAQDLSRSTERVIALSFGAEDYSVNMGLWRTGLPDEFLVPKSLVAMAAHAARLHAIAGVFTDLNDEVGLFEDTRRARQMGFTAKTLIHPSQIGPVHRAFRPSDAEAQWAREIVAAFESAKEKGTGVLVVNGRMVDEPVLLQAGRILRSLDARAE
jgi:citrate lyase subunit beta/citryl-CoA lyase